MLPLALVEVDAGLTIHRYNRAGQQLLARADGLCVSGYVLSGTDIALRSVDRCILAARPNEPAVGLVERPSGCLSYQLLVTLGVDGRSLLVLSDPVDTPTGIGATLRETYMLTDSEAAIAERIAGGMDLGQIAAARGVSRETVRRQLKRVFDKTGTRRQIDLVRIVAGGTAALWRASPRPKEGGSQ